MVLSTTVESNLRNHFRGWFLAAISDLLFSSSLEMVVVQEPRRHGFLISNVILDDVIAITDTFRAEIGAMIDPVSFLDLAPLAPPAVYSPLWRHCRSEFLL